MNSNPQPAVNQQSIRLRFHLSAQPLLHGLQLGMRNSPPQIDQPIVYNLTTTFAQSLLHLTTIFAAPRHYLCCTSLQIHLTTIFAALHHRSTGPHHDLAAPRHHRSDLTKIFAASYHRSALTTIFAAPHHRSMAAHHKLHCKLIETLHLHCKSW